MPRSNNSSTSARGPSLVYVEWSDLEAWLISHGTHIISYIRIGDNGKRQTKKNLFGVPMLTTSEVVRGNRYWITAIVQEGKYPMAIVDVPEEDGQENTSDWYNIGRASSNVN